MSESKSTGTTVLHRGQSMIEYTLIVALIIIAFVFVLAATGPVVGNIFSTTVINLLGGETVGDLPDVEGFWLTVTWVATQTPQELALPTRTQPPPTNTPTPGPSPTPSPVTPTRTPLPTRTPPPTPTPRDFSWVAPWEDSADQVEHWRLDNSFYLGSNDYYGQYYPCRDLNCTPDFELYNNQIDESLRGKINFDWGNGAPQGNWPSSSPHDNWGVRWRRLIYLEQTTTLRFDIPVTNNGIRIWILGGIYGGTASVEHGGPGNCSATGKTSGGMGLAAGSAPNSVTGHTNKWNIYDDAYYGFNPAQPIVPGSNEIPRDCLIVDRWLHGDAPGYSNITRTVPAGLYVLQIDYYEETSTAAVRVDIGSASRLTNPDDTVVNAGGNPVAGQPVCNWGQREDTNNSDVAPHMWEEYLGGNPAFNSRCYMELRGSIEIPLFMTDPTLSFWDVWDLFDGQHSAWVEIAEYVADGAGNLNRGALTWQRVNMHSGSTRNYNWTYQTINLANVGGVDYRGKRITIRFAIQNITQGQTFRWYIDSLTVDSAPRKTFYTAMSWNLDSPEQADDFITSGRWQLTAKNIRHGAGMSWEDSPGPNDRNPGQTPFEQYTHFSEAGLGNSDFSRERLRMHTIEFNGWIDLTDPNGLVDLEGDSGDAMLSFWHAFHIHRRTGLEIQYTTDPYSAGSGANWQPVPNHGILIPISRPSAEEQQYQTSFSFVEVPLVDIPATRFRLRFAMLVHNNASRQDGWWIDDIQLERRGAPKFTDYPFHDPAEFPNNDWMPGGNWGRIQGGYGQPPGQGWSYTDSPAGNYAQNMNSSLELRFPIDMNLDTPENPRAPNCNLGPMCETPDTAPVDPILTFWHWRALGANAHFYVEWKVFDAPDDDWEPLWAYVNAMTTYGGVQSTRTRISRGWERVEIDLQQIYTSPKFNSGGAGNPRDDDILIRFRFQTAGSSTNDGVYIDDIRIDERNERVHYLWPSTETRTDSAGNVIRDSNNNPISGSGNRYYDGLDNNPNLFNAWYFGGTWEVINWEQRAGLFAFHDSALDQDNAPPGPGPHTVNEPGYFNVLEMSTIFDLRGVDVSERPILYFWSRYWVRSSTTIRVEISYEDPSLGPLCFNGMRQCYEHLYGWSEWQTVWEQTSESRTYTWQREQVSLEPYAKQPGVAGKRIRVRFVTDALSSGTGTRDGWYLDEISIEYYNPRIVPIPFFDGARNLQNWITEGIWGLSPEFFRGAGGGPASLGTNLWNFGYWDMTSCPNNNNFRNCVSNFLGTQTLSQAHRQGVTLDINNDWGSSGPYGDTWNRDRFAGRWELTTPLVDGVSVAPGEYTFIVITDDGARLRYDTVPPGNLPPEYSNETWNIINAWQDQGRSVYMGTASLAVGFRYRFTLEYYERTNNAVIILSLGSNSFSFTDSPKQGSGPAFPEVPAVPRGNSSLMLNGVFDLSATSNPLLQYYTYHELGGTARVEVTTDGGFNWTSEGLRGSVPNGVWTSNWRGWYYPSTNLDRTGTAPAISNRDDGTEINFNYGNGSPPGWNRTDNFSIRWRRTLTLATPMTITFRTTADDGVRLWLNYTPGCSPVTSGDGTTNGGNGNFGDPDTGCLIIDNWRNQGATTRTVTRTLPAGSHTLQLDYYEATGGASVRLEMFTSGFDEPVYGGTWMPNNGDWRLKQHDFAGVAGLPAVGLRFRLDRLGTDQTNVVNQGDPDWLVSWWIVDVQVVDP